MAASLATMCPVAFFTHPPPPSSRHHFSETRLQELYPHHDWTALSCNLPNGSWLWPLSSHNKYIFGNIYRSLHIKANNSLSEQTSPSSKKKKKSTQYNSSAQLEAPASQNKKENTKLSASSDHSRGNPFGRKALGKDVVKWIETGMAAMAAKTVESLDTKEGVDSEHKIGCGLSFVMQAQYFLNNNPIPAGSEALCLKASTHYPTLFDNFQRKLQSILIGLQKRGVIDDWKQSKSWQLLKQLAKSDGHRVIARKAPLTKQIHEELGISRKKVAEIQCSIDDFVSHSMTLLQSERNAELEATQIELDAAPNPVSHKRSTEYLVNHGHNQQEDCDTICSLTAVSSSTGLGGTHLVSLKVGGGSRLPPTSISPGDMVCIRIANNQGVGTTECMPGFVHSFGEDGCSISVAIEARHGDPVFSRLFGKSLRIDRISALADPTTYERNVEALQNLQRHGLRKNNSSALIVAILFGKGPDIEWLVQHGSPSDSASNHDSQQFYVEGFDESQIRAITLGLTRQRPVSIIQGPPGTGKTNVFVKVLTEAAARGEKILATAPTNAAVDNLVEKLATAGLNIVRIGNPVRIATSVASKSLSSIVESKISDFQREITRRKADLRTDLRQCLGDDTLATGIRQLLKQLSKSLKQKEREIIDETIRSAQVILSTCTGSGDSLIQKLPAFDLVAIDEAGQAIEPACWIPLLRGIRAILAGDPCQLAPTILSRHSLDGGLGISLLERASKIHEGTLMTMLTMQYRMHDAICQWTSKEMYKGLLMSSPTVASHLLRDLPDVKATWITQTPLLLLDTRLPYGSLLPGCEECLDPAGTGSYFNEGEADIVVSHVKSLLYAGISPMSIAVQSPYIAQVQILRDKLDEVPESAGVEVSTIDSFQGREADAVIISMVRSNALRAIGFLGDRRRLNVAMTRARMHVAVVCDSLTISHNKFLLRLLQHIRNFGVVHSPDLSGRARKKRPTEPLIASPT